MTKKTGAVPTSKAEIARKKVSEGRKRKASKPATTATKGEDGAGNVKSSTKTKLPTKAKDKSKAPAKKEKAESKPAPQGHNNPPKGSDSIPAKALKGIVSQIEEFEEERKELAQDIKDIYTHAKDTGFDVKTVRKVIALRKQDKDARDEAQELVDEYMFALGDR